MERFMYVEFMSCVSGDRQYLFLVYSTFVPSTFFDMRGQQKRVWSFLTGSEGECKDPNLQSANIM